MAGIDDTHIERLDAYIRDHFEPETSILRSAVSGIIGKTAAVHALIMDEHVESLAKRKSLYRGREIVPEVSDFIKSQKNPETFSVLLDRLREERNLSPADLYKAADIDRKLYSKIMGEHDYHPSKNTVIAFGLALKLSDNEMDQLLDSAGFTLSKSVITDLIIAFCLEHMIYEIPDVNALLVAKEQPVLR
ncbi:hypothetical protein FACS1894142_2940 [Spirochaetia bacterium]|nr:hypothetical protein FACS1894142_2940 [Spirochaetia bacterium]